MTWTNLCYLLIGAGIMPCWRSLRWGVGEMRDENARDDVWLSIVNVHEDTK